MGVLQFLAARSGTLASKDEIIAAVWRGQAVSDDSLSVAIYELRKALGDDARRPRFVETLPGKGYRLLVEVDWKETEALADSGRSAERPPPRPFRGWHLGVAALVAVVPLLLFLRTADRGTDSSSYTTLAVLPLVEHSPRRDPKDRAFADGMTESLISSLARHSRLAVVSRTSSQRLGSASGLSMPEIAAELGADLLIEGSVTRVEDRVQVSLQLVDGAADCHLWVGSYDGDLGDILSLRWRIAEAVSNEIGRLGLAPDAASMSAVASGPRPVLDVRAVNAYLEGRQGLRQGGVANLEAALQALQAAVEIEPTFAEAHASLAVVASALFPFSLDQPARLELARRASMQALSLDPNLPEAHVALGESLLLDVPLLANAEAAFDHALRLDPSHPNAILGLSWIALLRGRLPDSERFARQAIQVDPLNSLAYRLNFESQLFLGRLAGARQTLDRLAEHLGEEAAAGARWEICHYLPNTDKVWNCYRSLIEAADPEHAGEYESTFRKGGLEPLMMRLMLEVPRLRRSTNSAGILLRLGRHEEALEALEQSLAKKDWDLFKIDADPALDALRGEPRFETIRRHLGLVL